MESKKMKAIFVTKYGDPEVLKLKQVSIPTPKENEVLVKIKATTVTAADSMMRRADPFISRFFLGFRKPKNPIPGTGFAGEIVATGNTVTLFKTGDSVFGETTLGFSTNAEFVCVPEEGVITLKPLNISFEEAAPVCDGALTSLNFLKNVAKIQRNQKVLINGASGSLGTAAIQLAKYFGAKVTGVCSTQNIGLVKSLGAERVIDYTKNDFTQNEETYDLIFDTVGKLSFSKCKGLLTKTGIYLSPVLNLPLLFQMGWTTILNSDKKAMFSATGILPIPVLRELLEELVQLLKSEKIKMVIDRQYPLEQVAVAHRYVDKGHKKGNVVIKVE